MKRVLLFIVTNLAVVLLLGVVASILGVDRFVSSQGLSLPHLLGFAAIFGFGGALFSLAISKQVALWTTGAKVITTPATETERWLVSTVEDFAKKSKIGMPDVAIYPGPELNAFATGARRDKALVAVSEGLLSGMSRREVEAVLAHEVAHVANGDMVTMTLLQGVLNTFVIAGSRAVAWVVAQAVSKDEDEGPSTMVFFGVSLVAQILFGILASLVVMAFSRHREFRADAGASGLVGAGPMIAALERLKGDHGEAELPDAVKAFGIRGGGAWMQLLSSHPPLEDRISALRKA